jgi:subtilisin family serine protease
MNNPTRSFAGVNRSTRLLAVLGLALPLIGALHGAPPSTVPGRLLVKPREGANEAALQQLFTSHGAQQHQAIHQINVRILNVPDRVKDRVLDALQHNPNIEFAEPDRIVPPELVANDTYYLNEWHLTKIQAPQAWDITTGSTAITIAILDTGVDGTHSDLAANMVAGWNFYDNNSDTSDVYGHGTAVAGQAAAIGNNAIGVAGPVWGCKIMPVRISDANGSAMFSTMASGLTWAADHGARVANISYIASTSSSVTSAAQYFQSKGGVVTVSAGNYATFDSSLDNPYVLTVSATSTDDSLWSSSNTGNNVDLAAPGVAIYTTGKGGGYVVGTGTSASAPIVAAVAAMVLSVNPGLTGIQVQDILKHSADDLGAPGWDPGYGWGRVNAYKAVLAARGGTPPPADTTPPTASITSPTSTSTVSGTVSVAVAASDNTGVTKVELYLNGALAGTSTTVPATFSWSTTTFPNGTCTLQARAYDAVGNSGSSAALSVTVQNPVADTTAPSVQLSSPAAGSIVAGAANVAVSATDNVGVTKVEWYLNGAIAGTSATSSATFSWNTATCPNGSCTLQAKAYDAAGNIGASTMLNVTVQNAGVDTTAPAVQITSPTSGATLLKTTKVYVTSADNVGVTRVDLLVDGKLYSTSSSSTPVFSWNTLKVARGSHTLQAVAYDAAGNSTRSSSVTANK